VRNNGYAYNAIESWAGNVVGSGIKPSSLITDSALKEVVHRLWLDWTDESDAEGFTDFYGQQRRGSAKGVVFVTIEDEHGQANLVVMPDVLRRFRAAIIGARLMVVAGAIERQDYGAAPIIHVRAADREPHGAARRAAPAGRRGGDLGRRDGARRRDAQAEPPRPARWSGETAAASTRVGLLPPRQPRLPLTPLGPPGSPPVMRNGAATPLGHEAVSRHHPREPAHPCPISRSHIAKRDQRRRAAAPRTAIAMARRCPTSTTSRLPRVTPLHSRFRCNIG
jgi:hypothetical protein